MSVLEQNESQSDELRMIDASAADVLRDDRQRARALRFTEPGFDRAKWAEFAELGWLMLRLDEERGGLGMGSRELCAIARRMGEELTPEPVVAAALAACAAPATQHEQLLSGETIVLPAFAGYGEEPPVFKGGRVSGSVADIPFGMAADAFVVQTASGAAFVRARSQGMSLTEHPAHDGTRFGRMSLRDVEAELVQVDMAGLREEATLANSAYLLGVAETALALTLDYIKQREQFGKPIGSFQALQHRSVDMLLQLRLGQAALRAALDALERQADQAESQKLVSLAAARAIKASRYITKEAIQLHGGIGYTDEADISLYLRKCLAMSGVYGSERFHRNRALALLAETTGSDELDDSTSVQPASGGAAEVEDLNTLDNETFRAEVRHWIEQNYPEEIRSPSRRLHLKDNWPWYKALSDKGWLCPAWPKEYGGMGLSAEKQVIMIEELERHGCARLNDHGPTMLGPLLIRYGSEAQRQEYLPKILSGEHIWCQGYSEPGAGSDLAALRTRAVRDGDEWVINGQKIWTTMASDANWIFLLARTDTEVAKQHGISFFLVPMDTPGVTVRPIISLEMHDDFCEVFFDDVRIPAENLVGEENKGWSMAKALLGFERVFIGSPRQADQAFSRLLELGEYCGMADDPVFQEQCSAFMLDLENHKSLYAEFVQAASEGKGVGPEVSLLKVSQSELFCRITEYMTEIAGVEASWTEDLDPETKLNPSALFLQARASTIYAGSSEIQRNIVAKAVLGLPS